jgi:ribosome-associated protein
VIIDNQVTMVEIPQDRLLFKYSRSTGPGGQNVNKVNTKVTVFFDVVNYDVFSDGEKKRILARLATRTNKDGVIHVVSQRFRTQRANRAAAVERLQELLTEALKTRPIRRKTTVPKHIKKKRLEEKRRHSLLKQRRAKKHLAEDLSD